MRAAANQLNGLDTGATGLIGGGGSPEWSNHEHELIFESRRQPEQVLDVGAKGLIGGGGSLFFRNG